jgi:hypothetical protein
MNARSLSQSQRGSQSSRSPGQPGPLAPARADDPALAAAETLARVMDRHHLDPLIGFVAPWAGDVISAGLGLYPVMLAWRRGAPRGLLARMLLNLSVDLLGGAVPLVGDVWDFFFRAHSRNLALLRARSTGTAVAPSRRDGLVVAGAVVVFLAALAVPIGLLWAAIAGFAGAFGH